MTICGKKSSGIFLSVQLMNQAGIQILENIYLSLFVSSKIKIYILRGDVELNQQNRLIFLHSLQLIYQCSNLDFENTYSSVFAYVT